MTELTQYLLKELFDYRDGKLYWKIKKGSANIGDRAGNVMKNGYRQIGINSKNYYTHRVIFLYHHGYLPEFLDHIDGDKSNNNIENLREATLQENQMNHKKPKSMNGKPTSSRFKGVCWDKQREKWLSHITIDGKQKHLGRYDTEIDAAKSYDNSAIKAFGEFANLNGV